MPSITDLELIGGFSKYDQEDFQKHIKNEIHKAWDGKCKTLNLTNNQFTSEWLITQLELLHGNYDLLWIFTIKVTKACMDSAWPKEKDI